LKQQEREKGKGEGKGEGEGSEKEREREREGVRADLSRSLVNSFKVVARGRQGAPRRAAPSHSLCRALESIIISAFKGFIWDAVYMGENGGRSGRGEGARDGARDE